MHPPTELSIVVPIYDEEESLPIGQPQIVRAGNDLTMISYGAMMRPTLEAAAELKEKEGVQAEVLDLLTVSPLKKQSKKVMTI